MDIQLKTNQSGLTLIEVIVSITIISIIFSLGLFFGIDFSKSYQFRSETSVIVSSLQRARSQSLNNINQARHGVHFSLNPLSYIIFQCPESNPQCTSYFKSPFDIIVSSNSYVTIKTPTPPFDVVFDQLSGCLSSQSADCNAEPVSIVVNDGSKSYTISINSEGGISW